MSYQEEISRRIDELIDSGDLDIIKNEMSNLENAQFNLNLRTLCSCQMGRSREQATAEISKLLHDASERVAIYQFNKEKGAALENIAVENYYRQIERRCEA